MSVRALKKKENQLNTSATSKQTLFKKSGNITPSRKFTSTISKVTTTTAKLHALQKVGRLSRSNPELRHPFDTLERFDVAHANLVRTKSENDVSTLLLNNSDAKISTTGKGALIAAKSEVCLQSISSHTYESGAIQSHDNTIQNSVLNQQKRMISGASSHRDLSQSGYINNMSVSSTPRRMSEWSYNSSASYSQHDNRMSASALTLATNTSSMHYTPTPIDPNAVLRVPIIGYEVMEERARFTVYKLRVENPHTNDCWLVLRRYTDFVRLNNKLKQLFPILTLQLPRKKIFGDNFNSVFLDNRVQGLQMFVNSIMAKEELRKCKLVREFFCLDEPPTYSESMEECRAIFEAQEETIAHLKLQISSKNELILSLQQKLREETQEKEQLKEALNHCTSLNNSVHHSGGNATN